MKNQSNLSVCICDYVDASLYTYPSCDTVIRSMQCQSCGFVKTFEIACKNRLCTKCLVKRAMRNLRKYTPLVLLFRQPALLTLTCKPQTYLNFREIRKQFRAFRHYYSKIRINAGLYVLETKQKKTGWHTHIHAVIDSSYYPQPTLSEEWRKSTGGLGFVVDIRRVDSETALVYLLKYMSKNHEIMNKAGEEEFLSQTRHTRLIQTFGNRYGFLVQKPDPYPCPECQSIDWSYFVDFNFCSTPKPKKPPDLLCGSDKIQQEIYEKMSPKEKNIYDLHMQSMQN